MLFTIFDNRAADAHTTRVFHTKHSELLCDLLIPQVAKLLGVQSDADFASRLDHDNKLPAARASWSCFTQSRV
jgi:hypothetical protein